jgi:hypothetical membrane protein
MAEDETRLGPLVHRSVHHAAIVWIAASVLFVVAMGVVQAGWTTSYSLTANPISDLGNTQCGHWPDSGSRYVCSPWHVVFNVWLIAFGLLLILGVLLATTAFPPRSSRTVGLGLVALAGIGAVGVGVFPENVHPTDYHLAFAVLAFLAGNLALMVLGAAMFRDTRWDGYRAYTMFSGLIGFVAFALEAFHVYLGLGVGGMERLIIAPLLLWLVVAGIHLLRVPAYAPRILPKSPSL